MTFDVVIRGGTVVDGSGSPGYTADVGVAGGRITAIGRLKADAAAEVIDADGLTVTPGFVDGHTHMDAQISWDPLGTCSCWHGVTTVVMGNCGFTLAPARPDQRHLVVRNLERAEDISAAAMAAGIDWQWETFAEYLDFVDALPKGINYAAYLGHSALRTYAMGERAFSDDATDDDMAVMEAEIRSATRAGAVGFTTSRSINHETADDRPVASRRATWDEVVRLVTAMADEGGGIFELAVEPQARARDERTRDEFYGRLIDLSVATGVPFTYGIISAGDEERMWKPLLDAIDDAAAAGGRAFGQAHTREFGVLLSFRTRLPFDGLAEWRDVRALPLAEQRRLMLDESVRARLVKAAHEGDYGRAIGAETRAPDWDWIFPMERALPPHRSIRSMAEAQRVDPVELFIDLSLQSDFDRLFIQAIANQDQETVLRIMSHRRVIPTFSDSGAHVSQIMDSSIQLHLLAHWVRQEQAFTLEEAVRMITHDPATAWGFHDRGLLRVGMAADINVIDPAAVAPDLPTVECDLPGGATRLVQRASGIAATLVGGEVFMRNGQHTGALPGRLLRRSAG
jgi:N-acyl-D-amino-acid deacylase